MSATKDPPVSANGLSVEDQAEAFFRFVLGPPCESDGRPTGCIEVRVFDADQKRGFIFKASQYKKTFSGWFVRCDAYRTELDRLRGVSAFVTLNPVRRDFLARINNRLEATRDATKDEDILCIRFLFIDIDPKRLAGVSSTDEELAAALAKRDEILADHPDLAASAYWGCSGNGAWILVLLPDYPNDEPYRKMIADALDSLRSRYNDDVVEIDEKPKNPSRVMACVGTLKCKGDSTEDRPYRRATLDSQVGGRVPFDLAEWLTRFPPPEPAPAPRSAAPTAPAKGTSRSGSSSTMTVTRALTVEERAIRYLAKCEPSVSGEKGHDKLLWAARIGPGFDLSEQRTFDLLKAHFNPRCEPEWSDKELRHKAEEAFKLNAEPVGFLRDAGQFEPTTVGRNGKVSSDHPNGTGGHPKSDFPRLAPGRCVQATDRGNFGYVVEDLGASARIRFESHDGHSAVVALPKSLLLTADGSPLSETESAADGDGEIDRYVELPNEDMGIVEADQVAPESVTWEWKDRIARGKFNLVAGEGGDGKSQFAIAIAAAISTGGMMPDGSGPAALGTVFILAAEDGLRDTIIPRLIAAGADLSRVKIITAKVKMKAKDGTSLIHPMSFQDLGYWRDLIRRYPDCRLLIADPIPAYLGRGVNDHRNADVRAVLEPFFDLLGTLNVATLGVTHLGKSVDARLPTHKILGSVAYANLARSIHVTVRDPEDKDRRLLCHIKNTLGKEQPTLAFRIAEHVFERDGEEIRTSRTVFDPGTVEADAADLMCASRSAKKRGPEPKKTTEVAEWLHDFLVEKNRPVPLAAIFDAAGEKGFLGKKQENGKWSSISALYRAKDAVPTLPEPRNDRRIEDLSMPVREGGRNVTHWYMVSADAVF